MDTGNQPVSDCSTVIKVRADATVLHVAQLMRSGNVKNVYVLDGELPGELPRAIITESDIVRSIVALGLDPSVFTVGDIVNQ